MLSLWASLGADAANHYIRAGASGLNNGSSWANAWTSFRSVTWIRGDIYYVAGGAYNENVLVAKALSGTLYITVKKANTNDNSGDAGWDASYVTTQAVINGTLEMDNGYVEFDGVTGSGTSGHGIMVLNTNTSSLWSVLLDGGNNHLLCTEIMGPGFGTSSNHYDGVYCNITGGTKKGLRVSNCWIHQVNRNGLTLGNLVGTSYDDYGMLFESNVVSEIGGCLDPSAHGQGMQIGFNAEDGFTIIRSSRFRNITGTGMLVWLGNAAAVHHDARIYNNIFSVTDNSIYVTTSPGVLYSHVAASACSNLFVANNTIVNISNRTYGGLAQFILDTPGATNNVLMNNLWEGCFFSASHRGWSTQSNNGYFNNGGNGVPRGTTNQMNGSLTTLVNAPAGNFNLRPLGYAISAGLDLSSFFTTDAAGNSRIVPWDIGAYQHLPGAAPAPPTHLRVVAPPAP